MGLIYLTQRLADGKVYVGQTIKKSLIGRYRSFASPILDRCNRPIDRAFRKHGGKAFQFLTLMDGVPDDQLDAWERWWIKALNATDRECGYNLESGGNKKKKLSPETKEKMSAWQKGRPMTGSRREAYKKYWASLKGVYKPWPASRKAAYTKSKHPLYKRRTWRHPVHGEFIGSIVELIEAFPEQKLSRGNLSGLATKATVKGYGRYSHKGWTCPETEFAMTV